MESKNFGLKAAVSAGLVGLVLVWGGCGKQTKLPEESLNIRMGVSQINRGVMIRYCGMLNENTFSLSEVGRSSVNFHYSKNSKEIVIGSNRYELISVTPEEIELKKIGRVD